MNVWNRRLLPAHRRRGDAAALVLVLVDPAGLRLSTSSVEIRKLSRSLDMPSSPGSHFLDDLPVERVAARQRGPGTGEDGLQVGRRSGCGVFVPCDEALSSFVAAFADNGPHAGTRSSRWALK